MPLDLGRWLEKSSSRRMAIRPECSSRCCGFLRKEKPREAVGNPWPSTPCSTGCRAKSRAVRLALLCATTLAHSNSRQGWFARAPDLLASAQRRMDGGRFRPWKPHHACTGAHLAHKRTNLREPLLPGGDLDLFSALGTLPRHHWWRNTVHRVVPPLQAISGDACMSKPACSPVTMICVASGASMQKMGWYGMSGERDRPGV